MRIAFGLAKRRPVSSRRMNPSPTRGLERDIARSPTVGRCRQHKNRSRRSQVGGPAGWPCTRQGGLMRQHATTSLLRARERPPLRPAESCCPAVLPADAPELKASVTNGIWRLHSCSRPGIGQQHRRRRVRDGPARHTQCRRRGAPIGNQRTTVRQQLPLPTTACRWSTALPGRIIMLGEQVTRVDIGLAPAGKASAVPR